ncbi:hypothetical protein ACFE04_012125 [Oxalis oulophora]
MRSLYCSLLMLAILALTFSFANSTCGPGPMQDFCIGVPHSYKGRFVNGEFCKNPKNVTVDDFKFGGINVPGNTTNSYGSSYTAILPPGLAGSIPSSIYIPGGLGVTMGPVSGAGAGGLNITTVVGTGAPLYAGRWDLAAKGGLSPPHAHPRASEIIHITKGKVMVGFVAGRAYGYRLFVKTLKKGQGMVIPHALPHFMVNVGKKSAVTLSFYNSGNPGKIFLGESLFLTNPPIGPNIIAKTLKIAKKWAERTQRRFQAE